MTSRVSSGRGDQRGRDREPVGGDQPGLLHDADRGRHEEQREVPQQRVGDGVERGRGAADEHQADEDQAHAEHRAGEGDAEAADDHLAGELAEEEQRQGVDHGARITDLTPDSRQAAPLPSAAKASGAAT